MKLIVAAAASLVLLGTAQAQVRAPLYGELGYSFLDVENFGQDANPQALRGIIGYGFHPFLAVEGMAAFGTSGDNAGLQDLKLRSAFGLYAKPRYQINNFEVFARLGWAHTQVRANLPGRSTTDKDDDFSWGVGANYHFNPRMYVGADWMRYTSVDHLKVQGVTINFGYRF
jgi:outer membrane autotransporter protein